MIFLLELNMRANATASSLPAVGTRAGGADTCPAPERHNRCSVAEMTGWWDEHVIDTGRLPLFLCLLAFVITFVVTRLITRSIRAGRGPFGDNVSESGLHIHHAVPGVIILICGAFLAVGAHGQAGWAELAGLLVGVGTSLVLDEFALILRLDDVYWSEEGRVSVEIVTLAAACLGLILIGANPFRFDGSAGVAGVIGSVVSIATHLTLVLITVMKGKYRTALVGAFMPGLASIAAIRLARPDSRWARRHYDEHKRERARGRADRFDRRWGTTARRAADLVGGRPADDLEPDSSRSSPRS